MVFWLPFESVQFFFALVCSYLNVSQKDKWVSFKCQLYIYGRYMIVFLTVLYTFIHFLCVPWSKSSSTLNLWNGGERRQGKKETVYAHAIVSFFQRWWRHHKSSSVIINYWTLNWAELIANVYLPMVWANACVGRQMNGTTNQQQEQQQQKIELQTSAALIIHGIISRALRFKTHTHSEIDRERKAYGKWNKNQRGSDE